jgi:hypothetical protein
MDSRSPKTTPLVPPVMAQSIEIRAETGDRRRHIVVDP